jgi:hypothetical protein
MTTASTTRDTPRADAPNHRPRPVAGRWQTGTRIAFGGFFAAMAGYNALLVVPRAAAAYRDVAEIAWPGVDRLVLELVVPAATPVAVTLVGFELGVAGLVLSSGRAVRVGLLAATAFMVGLAPLMSSYELANLPLIAVALVLLTREHERSLVDLVRGTPRTRSGGRLPDHG